MSRMRRATSASPTSSASSADVRERRLRRTWLFVAGADEAAHAAAARSGADVIILELEDFTPPELRPRGRFLSANAFATWRKVGAIAGVRVNPLETDGLADLAGIAKPDVLMMSKVDSPEQVVRLEAAAPPDVELAPNIESARGLVRIGEIARASKRIKALLVASED